MLVIKLGNDHDTKITMGYCKGSNNRIRSTNFEYKRRTQNGGRSTESLGGLVSIHYQKAEAV